MTDSNYPGRKFCAGSEAAAHAHEIDAVYHRLVNARLLPEPTKGTRLTTQEKCTLLESILNPRAVAVPKLSEVLVSLSPRLERRDGALQGRVLDMQEIIPSLFRCAAKDLPGASADIRDATKYCRPALKKLVKNLQSSGLLPKYPREYKRRVDQKETRELVLRKRAYIEPLLLKFFGFTKESLAKAQSHLEDDEERDKDIARGFLRWLNKENWENFIKTGPKTVPTDSEVHATDTEPETSETKALNPVRRPSAPPHALFPHAIPRKRKIEEKKPLPPALPTRHALPTLPTLSTQEKKSRLQQQQQQPERQLEPELIKPVALTTILQSSFAGCLESKYEHKAAQTNPHHVILKTLEKMVLSGLFVHPFHICKLTSGLTKRELCEQGNTLLNDVPIPPTREPKIFIPDRKVWTRLPWNNMFAFLVDQRATTLYPKQIAAIVNLLKKKLANLGYPLGTLAQLESAKDLGPIFKVTKFAPIPVQVTDKQLGVQLQELGKYLSLDLGRKPCEQGPSVPLQAVHPSKPSQPTTKLTEEPSLGLTGSTAVIPREKMSEPPEPREPRELSEQREPWEQMIPCSQEQWRDPTPASGVEVIPPQRAQEVAKTCLFTLVRRTKEGQVIREPLLVNTIVPIPPDSKSSVLLGIEGFVASTQALAQIATARVEIRSTKTNLQKSFVPHMYSHAFCQTFEPQNRLYKIKALISLNPNTV